MTRKIKNNLASWSYAQVWDKFPIPARPCPKELAILEKETKKLRVGARKLNLLILGSTIEYRLLAKKLGIKPYVADFSRENYEALTNYSKEKFEGEHFMQVDWLKIEDKNKYDVILGHRPINVISHTQITEFFERMHRALKLGGIFFCRGNIRFPGDKDNLKELIKKWAFKKDRPYSLFTYIEVKLYFHCADKNGYVDYPKARALVNNWFKHGKISRKDYELAKILVSMSDEARFRGLIEKKEIVCAYKKAGFQNVKWLFTGDEFAQNMPIIRLIK